jgi:hypothetical protein
MDIRQIKKRFYSMEQEAQDWIPIWQDLSTFIKPMRGFFPGDRPNYPKTMNTKKVLSSHANQAVKILAAGMTSGLTSPSRPWFKLSLPDKEMMKYYPVKIWIEQVEKALFSALARSNMYGIYYNTYEEIASFGTSGALMIEDFESGLRGRGFTIGEYYLSTDNTGRVNGFGRSYYMTVGQMVAEFGLENCSDQVRVAFKNDNVDQKFKVNHLIEKNDSRIVEMFNNRNMAFRSVYYECGQSDREALKITGFEEFPGLCPRWDTINTMQIYGMGPSWDAVADIKMHQAMERRKLEGLDKMMNPPLLVDASIDGEINTVPGGITRSSSATPTMGMRSAYEVRPDFQALQYSINDVKNDISKAFYSDLFMMISNLNDGTRTATEIATRQEEKLIQLGRVLTQLQNELLDPSIGRAFNILNRINALPLPPQELQGMDIEVEYISILAQAQKMVGTGSVEKTLSFVGSIAAVNAEVLDNVDFDEAVNKYAEMS